MTDANEPGGGMPDLGGLLAQAQQMMQQAAEAAEETVEGVAGGGLVRIKVNGRYEFESVSINPEAFDADDPSLLEDLVLAALRDATEQINDGQPDLMGGMDLGGMDLGGLGGMLGGGSSS